MRPRLFAVLLAATLLAGCGSVDVVITPGINPSMSRADVERAVTAFLREMEYLPPPATGLPRFISMTAVPSGPTVAGGLTGISWMVDIEGTFIHRGRGLRFTGVAVYRGGAILLVSDSDGVVYSSAFRE